MQRIGHALGSALLVAGLAGGQAEAADLGRPAHAAVDYVRVCDAYGAGFFYIPGTETCLRIGGAVRADFSYAERAFYADPRLLGELFGINFRNPALGTAYANLASFRNWNSLATLARARIDLDSRTNTEYGMLRGLVRAEFQVGQYQEAIDPLTLFVRNKSVDTTVLREAYLQWGGLTAGLTYSLYNLPFFLTYSNPFTADQRTTMLAYTVAHGGFSASVAMEDPTARRSILGPISDSEFANLVVGNRLYNNYGGFRYPDLIATAKYDDANFSLQASGALHQVTRPPWLATIFGFPFTGNATDEWGWAALPIRSRARDGSGGLRR